jgi:hypothetical protein
MEDATFGGHDEAWTVVFIGVKDRIPLSSGHVRETI